MGHLGHARELYRTASGPTQISRQESYKIHAVFVHSWYLYSISSW